MYQYENIVRERPPRALSPAASVEESRVQRFADEVFADGKRRGKSIIAGTINSEIKANLKEKGIELHSDDVVIDDKAIHKYINHVKKEKGATVAEERYRDVEETIKNPTHIYEQLRGKYLVYVNTRAYDENGRVLKVVIHPNYTEGGKTYNVAKSFGVVNERDAFSDRTMYRKIK